LAAKPGSHSRKERKAEAPPLCGLDRLSTALRLMISECLSHYEAHREGVADGDMEAIHQARVALRRLRSVLKMFHPLLDPPARDGFDEALRDLGRALGAARDWDVFVEETLPAISRERAYARDPLRGLQEPAVRLREHAHEALRRTLAEPALPEMLRDLRAWSEGRAAFFPEEASERSLEDEAPDLLERLAGRALRRGQHLQHGSDEDRHALRKALKTLRYGLQMVEAVYGKDAEKPYRKALAALQEDLGALNDAIAAGELAHRLPPGLGTDVLISWSSEKRRAALDELPASWSSFRTMERFW